MAVDGDCETECAEELDAMAAAGGVKVADGEGVADGGPESGPEATTFPPP